MKVHSSGRELVLQPGLGRTGIAAPPQAESSNTLGDRAFDTGPVCVFLPLLGVSLGPCLLNRFIRRLRAKGDPAAHVPLAVQTGALLSGLAWTAGSRRKPCSDHGCPLLGAVFGPAAAGCAVGTGHLPVLPVDGEVCLGEAAVLGLPAGGGEDRAHQVDFALLAGSDHFPGRCVARVDQVAVGQEVALGEVGVDRGDQPHVLDGRWSRSWRRV